jgi:hypothetical protein
MGVKGGLLDPIPTSGPGMNRGFALGLGLLFVGVAELWLELSREEAESLRNTRMASFRGSTGENVMAGKAFAGAGRGESEPIVETSVDKIMSWIPEGEDRRLAGLRRLPSPRLALGRVGLVTGG